MPRKECISCIPLPQDNKYLFKSAGNKSFGPFRDDYKLTIKE